MQTVRLKRALLIETTNHPEGAVVSLPDNRAKSLVDGGFAEKADDVSEVANPQINPFADCIGPLPPDGVNRSPVDAALPTVEHNPGLIALENADKKIGNVRKAAKILAKPGEA